jgi:Protein kinase domain
MVSHPSDSSPPRLRGLDPARLLGLLDDVMNESPPQIPGWHISGVAGQGGSGVVWRAVRESDGVLAAIKIAPHSEPETVERIEQEAGFLRSFHHPNIVRLLESGPLHQGTHEGGLYLAMEYIDGPALVHELPEEGLPPLMAFRWFREIADAVAHAHDAGILHRDLKPGNVLMAPDGHVKVADFGLALPVHRRVHQLSLTRAGLVAGTAEYLPPEAYRRDYLPGPEGDIFALGVMLHEMLTGTPPRGAWKPASSRRGVDLRVDAIIARAMHPDPQQRWPDARAMLAALEAVLASPPRYAGSPLVTFPVRAGDFIWTLIGLFVLLAACGSLMRIGKSRITPLIDLVGDHSALTGGFQALYLLLMASVPLSLWQLVRLRRFRAVPLREALPAPFGIEFGHSRMAAALVAICQMFCLWLPALMLVNLFIGSCIRWLQPQDPPWVHGLAVTRFEDMDLISPWRPVFSDVGFWLWESMGPPAYGLAERIDRVSFTPFLTPVLMSLAGALLVTCLLATVWNSVRQWWRCGLRLRPLAAASAALSLLSLVSASVWQADRDATRSRRPDNDEWVVDARMTSHIRDLGKFVVGASGDYIPPLADGDWTAFYQETVDWRGRPGVNRREIPALLQNTRVEADVARVRISRYDQSWDPATGAFLVRVLAVESYDGLKPSGVCGAHDIQLELSGKVSIEGHAVIQKENFTRTPMYQSDRRAASHEEVLAWIRGFLQAVAGNDADDETYFADLLLEVPGGMHEGYDTKWIRRASDRVGDLRSLLGNDVHRLTNPMPVIQGTLSGGRTRINIPIHRGDAVAERTITADLVHAGGRWRCVKLVF